VTNEILSNRIYKQQDFVVSAINELVHFYKQRELFDSNKTAENYIVYYRNIREIEGQIDAMLREYAVAIKALEN
jgi:hypothetical protein